MDLSWWSDVVVLLIAVTLLVMFATPPILFFLLYRIDRAQDQHAVLRSFPLLGRVRYLLEHVGPELRQYLFDADREGRPFSRDDYRSVAFAGKYMNSLMSFGSKRDFEAPGWYVRNALLPTQMHEMAVVRESRIATRRYRIDDEGLLDREEHPRERRPPQVAASS